MTSAVYSCVMSPTDKDVEKWQEIDLFHEQRFLVGEEGLIERQVRR